MNQTFKGELVTEPARASAGWAALVEEQGGDVFHSPGWLEVLHATYGFEPQAHMLLGADGRPRAGFVTVRLDDLRGGRTLSLPFSDFCDPLVADPDDWRLLEGALDAAVPARLRTLRNDVVTRASGWRTTSRARWHAVDLTKGADALWRGIKVSARNPIRQADAKGVSVRATSSERDVRAFFEMHLAVRKHKYRLLAQPYRFFQAIREHFLAPGHGTLLLAEQAGEPIGGVLLIAYGERLYYKFNASRVGGLGYRPNDLLMWNAVLHGCQAGYAELDLGLSDWEQAGLIAYKEKYATRAGVISFLERDAVASAGPPAAAAGAGPLLGELTNLLTAESVSDEVTERAGELLYRYFA